MKWGKYRLGSLKVNGSRYKQDLILDRGTLRKRKKKPSRQFRQEFGHTPLSVEEDIPWDCKRLVIGTGKNGKLPVMDSVLTTARNRDVEVVVCPTPDAVELLKENPAETNAILHLNG
jgi:hypothetical protein